MNDKELKPKKKFKTTTITLLSGKQKRIAKDEVAAVGEQFNVSGGGRCYGLHENRL